MRLNLKWTGLIDYYGFFDTYMPPIYREDDINRLQDAINRCLSPRLAPTWHLKIENSPNHSVTSSTIHKVNSTRRNVLHRSHVLQRVRVSAQRLSRELAGTGTAMAEIYWHEGIADGIATHLLA